MNRKDWNILWDGRQGMPRDERYRFDWVPRSDAEVEIEKARREGYAQGVAEANIIVTNTQEENNRIRAREEPKPLQRADHGVWSDDQATTINALVDAVNELRR